MPLRMLFTAGPMYGHVNTVLPLALAARRAGHSVAFATGPDLAAYVRQHGLVVWPVGPTHAEAGGRAGLSIEYFTAAASKRAVDLVPRTVAWRPDVVVHEETEFAGAVAAVAAGAPEVVHGLGLPLGVALWNAVAPSLEELLRQWIRGASADSVLTATRLELCPPSLRPLEASLWPDVRSIRPTAGTARLRDRLPAALARLPYPRTAHLTLGTVFHQAPEVLGRAVDGLKALPMNLVVTVGPDVDPATLGRQPAHVYVARYLPHSLLLPRCALVVSHGGAGIMLGALAQAIPQLLLPQGADQFQNAQAAVRAGVALSLSAGDVTAARVEASASSLLSDPGFGAAASAISTEIAAMPHPDQVMATLEGDLR